MRAFLSGVMLVAAVAAGGEDGVCVVRQGLPNASRIWKAGQQEATMFYIGGAEGNAPGGTRDQLPKAVKAVFPAARGVRAFCAWNRAYPDNCSSIIETFRSMSSSAAVTGEGHWPFVALTVIDLSADDIGMPERQVLAALEGLVNRTRRRSPGRDMVMLHQADEREPGQGGGAEGGVGGNEERARGVAARGVRGSADVLRCAGGG